MLIPFEENYMNSKDFQLLIGIPKETIIEKILTQLAHGIKDSKTGSVNLHDLPYLAASTEILRNWLLSQCNDEQKEVYDTLKGSDVTIIGIDSSQMPSPKLPKNPTYELLERLFKGNQYQTYIDDNGLEWVIQKGRRNGNKMYYLYTEQPISNEIIQTISKEYEENGKTREVIEYDIIEEEYEEECEYEEDDDEPIDYSDIV